MSRRVVLPLLPAFLMALPACSEKPKPPRVVEVEVKSEEGKRTPMEASVSFQPQEGKRNQKPSAEPYKSEEGKFSVKFPKEPSISNKDLATSAGVLKVQTAKHEVDRNLVLSVSHTTYPPNFGDVDPAKILDGVRDGLKGQDGEVKVDRAITLGEDKLPTRDVRIEAGKNAIRVRLILVDRRLVQIMAVGTKDALEGKPVEEFFKSFELAK